MKSPYPHERLANSYTNCSGHMTKMATTIIYDKPFKYLLLWNQKANDLGTWYVALEMRALAVPGLHQ